MNSIFLGFDLGTTFAKAVAVDEAGQVRQRASLPMKWKEQHPGWGECSADVFVSFVETLTREIVKAETKAQGSVHIAGMGFTSLAESGVLVDSDDTPVAPIIAWFDPRGETALSTMPPDMVELFSQSTGLPFTPLASVFKLAWLRQQGMTLRGHQWLSVPEYVCVRLGSRRASELSLLGRTGFLDVGALEPFEPSLKFLGVDRSFLPDLVGAGQPLGRVGADFPVAEARGAVLCVAGHDHLVAAAASGAARSGSVLNSMGTAEALVVASDTMPSPESVAQLVAGGLTVGAHVVADTTCILAGQRTGLVLKKAMEMLGDDFDPDDPSLQQSDGLRRQEGDAEITIVGLNMADTSVDINVGPGELAPGRLWSAALQQSRQGVVSRLDMMRTHGVQIEELMLAGGWTNLASVRASRHGIAPRTHRVSVDQPGSLGAARFARWAVEQQITKPTDALERPSASFFG